MRVPIPPVSSAPRILPDGRALPSQLEIVRKLCKRGAPGMSLAEFVVWMWPIVEPTTPLTWNWHHDVICNELQAQLEGGKFGRPWYQNAIYNVPPGSMKSLIMSVGAPAWKWTWDPSWRAIFASASPSVALRDSVRCREVIESPAYRETFQPSWELADDQNAKGNFKNTATGFRQAISVDTKITGSRADFLGLDDPLDADDALSKVKRDSTNGWIRSTFSNRLNNLETGVRAQIMQRLHADDPTGHMLSVWDKVRHVCLPQEYESNHPFRFEGDPRTVEGELLDEVRFPLRVLKGDDGKGGELRVLGEYGYAGQHQQRPAPADGGRFKRSAWRFWSHTAEIRERPQGATIDAPLFLPVGKEGFQELIGTWDCAFKKKDDNDRVCGLTIAKRGADRFVLWAKWDRLSFTETCEGLLEQRRLFPKAYWVGVEDKANGSAVIETMSRLITGVCAVEPEGGKEARAASIEPTVLAGNVYLPEGAEWLEQWFEEFAQFPKGPHDDAVDALSQGLRYFMQDGSTQHTRMLLGL